MKIKISTDESFLSSFKQELYERAEDGCLSYSVVEKMGEAILSGKIFKVEEFRDEMALIKFRGKDFFIESKNFEVVNTWFPARNFIYCIYMQNLTQEEQLIIMEAARISLADAEIFDYIADELDLADSELEDLERKIQKECNLSWFSFRCMA